MEDNFNINEAVDKEMLLSAQFFGEATMFNHDGMKALADWKRTEGRYHSQLAKWLQELITRRA